MLPRKTREHLEPALQYLKQENVPYDVVHAGKHGCLTTQIGDRAVKWFFSMSPSDARSALNFKAKIKRAVQRHRRRIAQSMQARTLQFGGRHHPRQFALVAQVFEFS